MAILDLKFEASLGSIARPGFKKKYRDKEVAEAWGGLGEREMKRGGVGKERGKEWNG